MIFFFHSLLEKVAVWCVWEYWQAKKVQRIIHISTFTVEFMIIIWCAHKFMCFFNEQNILTFTLVEPIQNENVSVLQCITL